VGEHGGAARNYKHGEYAGHTNHFGLIHLGVFEAQTLLEQLNAK
jgi:hypothetical protein